MTRYADPGGLARTGRCCCRRRRSPPGPGQFREAGAEVSESLEEASVIFGVKQVPKENILPNRTYVFFSHTIKVRPWLLRDHRRPGGGDG